MLPTSLKTLSIAIEILFIDKFFSYSLINILYILIIQCITNIANYPKVFYALITNSVYD